MIFQVCNSNTSTNNPLLHAEIIVLNKLKKLIKSMTEHEKIKYIQNLEIFVNMEPCIFCIGSLRLMEIPKIYYSLKNPRFGGCGSVCNGHTDENFCKFIPQIEIYEDTECLNLLKEFYDQVNMKAPEHKRKIKKKS